MPYSNARKIPCLWAILATTLFLMDFNAFACRFDPDLASAWKEADLVVLGKAKKIKQNPQENSGTGITVDYSIEKNNLIEAEEIFKGKAEKEIIVFDSARGTTATFAIYEPNRYVLFLKQNKDVYKPLRAINLSNVDENATRTSVKLVAGYCELKSVDEKRKFIEEKFADAPPLAREFMGIEAYKVKAKGLIPIYEKELEKDMPAKKRLYILGSMRNLGANTSKRLLAMLNDPKVHEKWNVIEEIRRHKNAKDFEPEIRKFVNDPDELTSIAARTALLDMGFYDVIPSLLRTARDSEKNKWNAIFGIYNNTKLPLSEEDIAIIKELQNSKDESVARAAKSIIEDLKKKK